MKQLRFQFRALGIALALVISPCLSFAQIGAMPTGDQALCESLNHDAILKYEYGSRLEFIKKYPNDSRVPLLTAEAKSYKSEIELEPSMYAIAKKLTDRFGTREKPFLPKAPCFFSRHDAVLRNYGLIPPPWIATCGVDASTPDSDSLLAVFGTTRTEKSAAPSAQPSATLSVKTSAKPGATPGVKPSATPEASAARSSGASDKAEVPGTQGVGTIGFYSRFGDEDRKTARIRYAENLWEKFRACDYNISWLVSNTHARTDDITAFAWKSACNSWDPANRVFFNDLVNDAEAYPAAAAPPGSKGVGPNPLPTEPPSPAREMTTIGYQDRPELSERLFFREYDLAYKSLSFCASILDRTYPPNTKRFLCQNSNLLGGLMFGAVALLNGKTTSATSTGLATLGGLLVTSNPITCASNVGGQGPSIPGGTGSGRPTTTSSTAKQPASKTPR